MSVGAGGGSGKSEQSQFSGPLNPSQVGQYYDALNSYSNGRLNKYFGTAGSAGKVDYQAPDVPALIYNPAQTSRTYTPDQTSLAYDPIKQDITYTPDATSITYAPDTTSLTYNPLTNEDIRAVGGLGATRELAAEQARRQAIEQVSADPSQSLFQRQRSNQLTNRDYMGQVDAIKKESEAAATNLKADQMAKAFDSLVSNRGYLSGQQAQAYDSKVADRGYLSGQQKLGYDSQVENRGFTADQTAKQYDAAAANRAYLADQLQKGYQADIAGQTFNADQAAKYFQSLVGQRDYMADQSKLGYASNVRNADLTKDDLLALAQIYFAGKGQQSASYGLTTDSKGEASLSLSRK